MKRLFLIVLCFFLLLADSSMCTASDSEIESASQSELENQSSEESTIPETSEGSVGSEVGNQETKKGIEGQTLVVNASKQEKPAWQQIEGCPQNSEEALELFNSGDNHGFNKPTVEPRMTGDGRVEWAVRRHGALLGVINPGENDPQLDQTNPDHSKLIAAVQSKMPMNQGFCAPMTKEQFMNMKRQEPNFDQERANTQWDFIERNRSIAKSFPSAFIAGGFTKTALRGALPTIGNPLKQSVKSSAQSLCRNTRGILSRNGFSNYAPEEIGSSHSLSTLLDNAMSPMRGNKQMITNHLNKHWNVPGCSSKAEYQSLLRATKVSNGFRTQDEAAAYLANKSLEDIMSQGTWSSGVKTIDGKPIDIIKCQLPNGIGARWNRATGAFMSFLGKQR